LKRKTILSIDTAGPVVGISISGPTSVQSWSGRCARQSDQKLLPILADFLRDDPAIDCVVVSVGPGAFTGLRVGVSMALGVAMSRSIPVCPVSSLQVRALLAGGPRVLSLLDARRGRVYGGVFECSGHVPVLQGAEGDVALSSLIPQPPFVAVGEGAVRYADEIQQAGGRVLPMGDRCPVAEMTVLANYAPVMKPEEVALRYLRAADATPPTNLGKVVGSPRLG